MTEIDKAVRAAAMALPDVEVGVACAGTTLESTTYHVKKKNFAFVAKGVARFKVGASAAAVGKAGGEVGAGGWAKLAVAAGDKAPAQLARWIAESYTLVVGDAAKPVGVTASPKRTKSTPAKSSTAKKPAKPAKSTTAAKRTARR